MPKCTHCGSLLSSKEAAGDGCPVCQGKFEHPPSEASTAAREETSSKGSPERGRPRDRVQETRINGKRGVRMPVPTDGFSEECLGCGHRRSDNVILTGRSRRRWLAGGVAIAAVFAIAAIVGGIMSGVWNLSALTAGLAMTSYFAVLFAVFYAVFVVSALMLRRRMCAARSFGRAIPGNGVALGGWLLFVSSVVYYLAPLNNSELLPSALVGLIGVLLIGGVDAGSSIRLAVPLCQSCQRTRPRVIEIVDYWPISDQIAFTTTNDHFCGSLSPSFRQHSIQRRRNA